MLFSQSLSLNQSLATRVFSAAIKREKLARAYLLAGQVSEDKKQLATQLAAYFNCEKVKSGQLSSCLLDDQIDSQRWCTNCRWIAADLHPQAFLKLSGEESKSGKITVEQARLLCEEINKSSPYFRVVIIENASQEALHRPAANALLKTIEEPRSNVLLIFFAQAVNEVLATVLSRCQVINMSNKNSEQFFSLLSENRQSLSGFLSNRIENLDQQDLENVLISLEKFSNVSSQLVDAVKLAEVMQSLIKQDDDLDSLLDFFVINELLSLKNFFTIDREARYAKELFLLGQIAKEQSKHYVGQKVVVETFVFAWHKLKQTGVNPLRIRA